MMQRERKIRTREAVTRPSFNMVEAPPPSSAGCPTITSAPRQRSLMFRHQTRRTTPRGHLNIVSAGVHHGSLAVLVFYDDFARERQLGFLFDRQRVKFSPQHHSGAGPFFITGSGLA
jgi:hypothetical protein